LHIYSSAVSGSIFQTQKKHVFTSLPADRYELGAAWLTVELRGRLDTESGHPLDEHWTREGLAVSLRLDDVSLAEHRKQRQHQRNVRLFHTHIHTRADYLAGPICFTHFMGPSLPPLHSVPPLLSPCLPLFLSCPLPLPLEVGPLNTVRG